MRKLGPPVNENQRGTFGQRPAPGTTQAALGRARDGAEMSALSANGIAGFSTCGLALLLAFLCLVSALPARAQDSEWLYHCPDGSMFFASGGRDAATLHAFGNTWRLPITLSADGARYSDGHITFWNRGYTALVERDGKLEFHDCLYTPPDSPAPTTGQGQPSGQQAAVTGTATYRERMALPPKSALIVYVEEGDVPAGPSKVIAEQRISIEHQVPIVFELHYDASRIQPRGRYQVAARIVDGDRVLFATDTNYRVITGYPNHVDLLLKRAAASPHAAAAPAGSPSPLGDTSWELVEIQYSDDTGARPDDSSHDTAEFQADGALVVRADCNRGRGAYKVEGSGLTFGPMAMTLAMCGPGSLSDRYVRALDAVYAYSLRDGYLYLSLRTDTGIMKFRPAVKSGQPTLK